MGEMVSAISWIIGLYLFVMLITLGHFYRCGKLGPREWLSVLGAPLWWLLSRGVNGTLRTMGRAVYENHLLWAIGFIAVGHFLATTSRCSTVMECSALAAKATLLSLPPVAFVYWGYIFGSA